MGTIMNRLGRVVTVVMLLAVCAARAQNAGDALERGFQNPPDSAKPRVWWHWMNGNITKEGIKLDLEWMKRIGLGGFQNFDAALLTPKVVDKRLVYMTPEWKDAFLYATTLADHLGFEMAIAGSPGWSETGGPWVSPAHAMKKLVWSTMIVEGGHPYSGVLPKPPSTTGPFQNIPRPEGFNPSGAPAPALPEYFADSAVVAYRLPEGDVPMGDLQPKITSSAGQLDFAALSDGDLARTIVLPGAPADGKAWIQFEFAQPQTIRAVTLGTGRVQACLKGLCPAVSQNVSCRPAMTKLNSEPSQRFRSEGRRAYHCFPRGHRKILPADFRAAAGCPQHFRKNGIQDFRTGPARRSAGRSFRREGSLCRRARFIRLPHSCSPWCGRSAQIGCFGFDTRDERRRHIELDASSRALGHSPDGLLPNGRAKFSGVT